MATDHRGNPINENNPAKTNAERMGDSTTGMTDAQMMDAEMYRAEKDEYPDMDEDPEQIKRSEQYAQEMYDYHKPLPSDRVYGKDEMIEHDRDDDKY